MKKLKKILSINLLIIAIILISGQNSIANSNSSFIGTIEYTQEFEEYLKLTEEEKSKITQPRVFEIKKNTTIQNSPLGLLRMMRSSTVSQYSLKDIIPENLAVKNQEQTNLCWAFSSLSSLETNLAIRRYNSGLQAKEYDFSERHMEYATSSIFANGQTNENGFNRNVGSGGTFYISTAYLTNGTGAISEEEMPFENNEDLINLSEIENKTVSSQVYDTIDFPAYSQSEDTTQIEEQIKEHVKNYGAVNAGIHGASLLSDYYNNETGAIYCDDEQECPINHAVAIIGWDDNYDVNNFNEDHRPKNNGAWIIKNSWGAELDYDLLELKTIYFNAYKETFEENNITEPSLIKDEFIEALGYTIENGRAHMKVGKDGFMYISYEDVNIYKQLNGIIKSSDTVDYENIYQYNNYGVVGMIPIESSKVYLANVFDKKTSGKEYITQVGINATENYTCKVYVNPNGDSKEFEDMQEVQLKAGDSETFGTGYHTLEFLNPVEIKSDKYVVMVEIEGTQDNVTIGIECKIPGTIYSNVKVENNKTFVTAEGYDYWLDLSKLDKGNPLNPKADSTIKAFTVSKIEDNSLKNIEITKEPNKTKYFEGENFDKTGMVVKANYNNGKSNEITDYSITNGTDLKEGQTSVIISYEGKTVQQKITVEKNTVTNIEIKTPPTKLEYKAGQDFDKTGMIIEVTYKNGDKKEITDYEITNGVNLKNGQTSVEIKYEEKTVTQPITVEENLVTKLEIQKQPDKIKYVVGQNFDKTGMVIIATYQDNTTIEIKDYTIKNGTNLSKDQTSVEIEFEGKTVIQPITVEEKSITSIEIGKMPNKTQYVQNVEDLDLTGGTIIIKYNDNTTEEIPMTNEQISVSEFDNKEIGKAKIVLTYQNQTVEFEVEVIEKITEEAENSVFDENMKGEITKIELFVDENNKDEEYFLLEFEISGITLNQNNDKLEYYYYISDEQEEENIQEWVKIGEYKNNGNKISFKINSKDIKNFDEIINADKAYIYLKEVAIKGGDQKVAITKVPQMDISENVEIYINGAKMEDMLNGTGNGNNSNKDVDNTISNTSLPKTGVTASIICIIVIITVVGIILYVRYRNLNKYVK